MKPWTLIDFFPKNFLFMVDESARDDVADIGAMYNGDRMRKE